MWHTRLVGKDVRLKYARKMTGNNAAHMIFVSRYNDFMFELLVEQFF